MKQIDKYPEIRIYQSLWKSMLLAVGCLAFSVGGCMIIIENNCDLTTKILGGWLNVIFFGGIGLFLIINAVYNVIRCIPFLIIYDDRLEFWEQRKRSYYTINYADVKKFRLVKIYSSKMITVDYKTAPLIYKFDEASDLKQSIMNFNFNEIGAIENIPVHNMTMKGKEICDILNRRLNCWQVRLAE